MSFVFGLLIAIVVFSSASKRGSYIHAMVDEEYDIIIKDFFTGNFNVPVADRTRLQKSAYVKFWRLRKGLSVDFEANLLYEKKKIIQKSD